jgi:hypothetical protein
MALFATLRGEVEGGVAVTLTDSEVTETAGRTSGAGAGRSTDETPHEGFAPMLHSLSEDFLERETIGVPDFAFKEAGLTFLTPSAKDSFTVRGAPTTSSSFSCGSRGSNLMGGQLISRGCFESEGQASGKTIFG